MTVTKSEDFKGALEHAVAANKPFLLDVHVDADVRPPATGTWQLPPTPYKEPAFGKALGAGRAVAGEIGLVERRIHDRAHLGRLIAARLAAASAPAHAASSELVSIRRREG